MWNGPGKREPDSCLVVGSPQKPNQIKSSSLSLCYLSIHLFIYSFTYFCSIGWSDGRMLFCSVWFCSVVFLFVQRFVRQGKQFWNIDFIISFFCLLFSPDFRSSAFLLLSFFALSVGRGFYFVFVYIFDRVLSRDISIKRAHTHTVQAYQKFR